MNAETHPAGPRPAAHLAHRVAALVAIALLALGLTAGHAGAATTPPSASDPFYSYGGSLNGLAPGTVLRTRTEQWHVASIPLPVTVVQLLYVTQNAQGRPDTNVTSVLLPPTPSSSQNNKLVAYGSFYDSLNPNDEPSVVFSGSPYSSNSELTTIETYDIGQMLLSGDTVSVADTEGQSADFAAGPEYGYTTLDGVRAAINASSVDNVSPGAKVVLMGYSGGAIATGWAAQEAPTYAPDVETRLLGATMGGVLIDPDHNLHYVEGSSTWAGVMPMALVGIARAYGINIDPYLSQYGQEVVNSMQTMNINTAENDFPGITWAQIAKPQYPQPEDVPVFVSLVNRLILGNDALPKVPMFIAQGTGGQIDGTQPNATYGAGDGVMLAGDVRSYAREVCASGDSVDYLEASGLSHELVEPVWSTASLAWVAARFSGLPATSDCPTIAPGNPLTPVPAPPGS